MTPSGSSSDIEIILSTKTVRERARKIFDLCKQGQTHFAYDDSKLEGCADFVTEVIREHYPSLEVPYHSRWRHFESPNYDRKTLLDQNLEGTGEDALRSKFDLIVASVLLDAGAGPKWKYEDPRSGEVSVRSEGLGVASFNAFLNGKFSNNPKDHPCRVDGDRISKLTPQDIQAIFQVTEHNPMEGLEGRGDLLIKLGETLLSNSEVFPNARPSDLLKSLPKDISATDVLTTLQRNLGSIWPGRVEIDGYGFNLGDTWAYAPFGEGADGLVPFHKLSQWLTYSLVETLEQEGRSVAGIDQLTGLPEYRNGGLFLDAEVISLREPHQAEQAHQPQSELIIEWRALTVHLLDAIAPLVRERIKKSEADFPLARVLEGGTWAAGRKLAKQKREGLPPLSIQSDGTVF